MTLSFDLLFFKAFFIIFQSFKFDGSVEDVEVSMEADDFDVILM